MNQTWLSALAILALGGCGHDRSSMMSDYLQDIGQHMDGLQAEETAHASVMASLSTIDGMQGTELTHWQRMEDHLDRMHLVMNDMMGCGHRIEAIGFSDSTQRLRSEGDAHRQAMQAAADVAFAQNEELRHRGAFHDTMIAMQNEWNAMMSDSRGYSCGM
jgi:hypothetical protein